MVTAESKIENVTAANKANVSGYILKPFDAKVLKAKIDSVFAMRAEGAPLRSGM
jgi:two-component system, chemotaxis family, chemotaxis protein CheY